MKSHALLSLSVSYTHLDVYKRQLLDPECFSPEHFLFEEEGTGKLFHPQTPGMARTCLEADFHRTLETFERRPPVSYTHLDVYKRQPQDYTGATFRDNCYLFFGKETAGLPEDFRMAHYDRCIRIPMRADARSLNLSNSVAILAYEALRQQGFPQLSGVGAVSYTHLDVYKRQYHRCDHRRGGLYPRNGTVLL